jgi:lipopolysaccharide heptosyltransferase I
MPVLRHGRILVVKPSSLGDIIHLFPALARLRGAFPDAELDFLVHPAFAGALDYSPWRVSHRILFERKKLGSWSGFPSEMRRIVSALRERPYDCVIDFQGLFRSAFFARVAARRAPVVGFALPREKPARMFYTVAVRARGKHAVERNVELANSFLGEDLPVPEIPVPPVPEHVAVPEGLPERYLLLLPGARWRSKCFPVALFAAAARRVMGRFPGLAAVIAGGDDAVEAGSELRRELPPDTVDLCGKTTLPEVFEVVRRAAGVFCNDSGPMHVAALMRRPLCAFFGSTRPGATGPWGDDKRFLVIRNTGLECLECMRRECRRGDYRCFDIDAAAAADALGDVLEKDGLR